MAWTGASERTAKNWISGVSGPSGAHLVDLMRGSHSVLEAVLNLSNQAALIPAARLGAIRAQLEETIRLIDGQADTGANIHVPCAVIKLDKPGRPLAH
jgi:hypothetical protein